ncbi:unnamed protein product [Caenorhabditis sp. 36 PRJEB53466]|nr:unnamed protein product [Caenorhabditis sp. 36 PRJEB53466]
MISSETIQLSLNLDHISEVDFGRLERRQRFRSRSVGHQRSDHNMLSRWASAISLEEINEYGKWKKEAFRVLSDDLLEIIVQPGSHFCPALGSIPGFTRVYSGARLSDRC